MSKDNTECKNVNQKSIDDYEKIYSSRKVNVRDKVKTVSQHPLLIPLFTPTEDLNVDPAEKVFKVEVPIDVYGDLLNDLENEISNNPEKFSSKVVLNSEGLSEKKTKSELREMNRFNFYASDQASLKLALQGVEGKKSKYLPELLIKHQESKQGFVLNTPINDIDNFVSKTTKELLNEHHILSFFETDVRDLVDFGMRPNSPYDKFETNNRDDLDIEIPNSEDEDKLIAKLVEDSGKTPSEIASSEEKLGEENNMGHEANPHELIQQWETSRLFTS
eukprot:GHVU01006852.1.p1 GENE.GHVU01006852.1~~GHVU01006852.1.p1  ORF type:complete len:321 (-),score=51.51 GHVU01006852.1:155-982(-)